MSGPTEFTLLANGQPVGPPLADAPIELPAGTPLALTVKARGYKDATRTVTLPANGTFTWEAVMEKQPFPQAGQPYENTLGQKFVPVPGTSVLFCIWETREQDYAAFVRATGQSWSSANAGVAHPAVNVSWDDAKAFCTWLTEKEEREGKLGPGQEYRLPTDEEWSVAVGLNEPSGGTPQSKDTVIKGVYPWGSQWPPPPGAGNYGQSLNVDSFAGTAPVGSFFANRYGIYDLGGNVWEWCEDNYDGSNGGRVLRGPLSTSPVPSACCRPTASMARPTFATAAADSVRSLPSGWCLRSEATSPCAL